MEDVHGDRDGSGRLSWRTRWQRGRRRWGGDQRGEILRWALFAFGLVCATGGGFRALHRVMHRARGPGSVAVWVRDRGAHVDFGLDSDALVVIRRPHAGRPEPTPPQPLPRGLRAHFEQGPMKLIAAAFDGREWDRARPAAWLLVSEPSGNPRSALANAGEFLERWVFTGTPARWQRAFRMRLPWEACALASRESGVWVGAARRCALRFFGHDGSLRVDEEFDDADGIEALAAAQGKSGGGVWAVAGGAVVRLRGDGHRLPGQGGFAHLVGVRVVGDPVDGSTGTAISRAR